MQKTLGCGVEIDFNFLRDCIAERRSMQKKVDWAVNAHILDRRYRFFVYYTKKKVGNINFMYNI